MIVHKLTLEQKNILDGQSFKDGSKFNVEIDINGNYFIGIEEAQMCNVEEFLWVKDLPTMLYQPKVTEII